LKTVRDYSGGRLEGDLVKFLKNPDAVDAGSNGPTEAEPFGDFKGADKLVILNDKTYKDVLKKPENANMLVMFYTPWCGHCKKMKKDYAEAAEQLASEKNSGKLAVVDCTVHRVISDEFSITGFPTLKYFENGVYKKDYNGKRTADALVEFVKGGGIKKDEL
jgi:protein disulfide-isomerase-like protein